MTEDAAEVWGYITKCRQLLMWQLSEEQNADLREIVFPALTKRPARRAGADGDDDYDRHETLHGRLRDHEYEDQLRQVMHIYHTVVMEVCDWMIYNKEYFHLLIGNYTSFDGFANAIDAAIIDECRGTQSRVWTRRGLIELDEPIQVGNPHSESEKSESLTTSPSSSESTLDSPPEAACPPPCPPPTAAFPLTPSASTAAAAPPTSAVLKHVLTPALAALTHLPSTAGPGHVHPKHHHSVNAAHVPHSILSSAPAPSPTALSTSTAIAAPPSPSVAATRRTDSVLFKPEPEIIRPSSQKYFSQSIDLLDDEAYNPHNNRRTVSPKPPVMHRGSLLAGSPRPLAAPLSRRPTIAEPRQLSGPTARRATIAYPPLGPAPLASPGPLSVMSDAPRHGSPLELNLVNKYTSAPVTEPASPDVPMGPTFEIATPFFTPSRPPSPKFEMGNSVFAKFRRNTVTAPASTLAPIAPAVPPAEVAGPTFEIATPFFRCPSAPPPPEPASPAYPTGPTFPISTPFWTYAIHAPATRTRPLSPEPDLGPTFPVNTPLFVYSKRQVGPQPEPASPDEPMGPTFEVATPLFTYAPRPAATQVRAPAKPASPISPRGPTFPISTPHWNPPVKPAPATLFNPAYSLSADNPQTIAIVPGLKVTAPSLASSKLDDTFPGGGISPKSEVYSESPPPSSTLPSLPLASAPLVSSGYVVDDAPLESESACPSATPSVDAIVVPEIMAKQVSDAPSFPIHESEPLPSSKSESQSFYAPLGFRVPTAKEADNPDSPVKLPDSALQPQPEQQFESEASHFHGSPIDSGAQSPAESVTSIGSSSQKNLGHTAAAPSTVCVPLPSPHSTDEAPYPTTPEQRPSCTLERNNDSGSRSSSPGSPKPNHGSRMSLSLSKRPSIFWNDREVDFTPSNPVSHTASASTSTAPVHSATRPASAHGKPPGGPGGKNIRPMSSNGSLQHQWWKIGRPRRTSIGTHSQD